MINFHFILFQATQSVNRTCSGCLQYYHNLVSTQGSLKTKSDLLDALTKKYYKEKVDDTFQLKKQAEEIDMLKSELQKYKSQSDLETDVTLSPGSETSECSHKDVDWREKRIKIEVSQIRTKDFHIYFNERSKTLKKTDGLDGWISSFGLKALVKRRLTLAKDSYKCYMCDWVGKREGDWKNHFLVCLRKHGGQVKFFCRLCYPSSCEANATRSHDVKFLKHAK